VSVAAMNMSKRVIKYIFLLVLSCSYACLLYFFLESTEYMYSMGANFSGPEHAHKHAYGHGHGLAHKYGQNTNADADMYRPKK
jgi:hypothetical protein